MNTCGMCSGTTTKTRHVILDFDMVSEIITFEEKGRFGKEKHQNLDMNPNITVFDIKEKTTGDINIITGVLEKKCKRQIERARRLNEVKVKEVSTQEELELCKKIFSKLFYTSSLSALR